MNKSSTKGFGMVVLWVALIGIPGSAALADVLLIDEVRASRSMDLPDNGLSMQSVENRWGTPLQRYGAVGEPPITRWQYSEYSVYFEHDLVITSVLHNDVSSQ